jgi:fructokinase
VISFDPNLRAPLWSDLREARAMIREGLNRADLVKMSGEELTFLTDENDMRAGAMKLCHEYPLKLLAVTLGAGGCIYCVNGRLYESCAFAVHSIDTTGAGDASWGAALSLLLDNGCEPGNLADNELYKLMDYANAAGSLATTKYGAIAAQPERNAIEDCIRTLPRLAIGV